MTPEIEEFAKLLVERVRDAAIQSCDRILQSDSNTVIGKRWKESRREASDAFAKILISDVVDETLANLLIAIDQEILCISYTASNGKTVDLTAVAKESGELSGWYGGGGGWCEKYSKERFVDDFDDLKDFFKRKSSDSDQQ